MQSHDAKMVYASFKRSRDRIKSDVLYSSLLGSSLGFGIGFLASQALQAQSATAVTIAATKLAVMPFVGPVRVGVLCALLGGVAASVYVYRDSAAALDSALRSLSDHGVPLPVIQQAGKGDLASLAQWSSTAGGTSGAGQQAMSTADPAALR